MKCPAKVRQALATHDGKALVVGYEDGAVQAFLIVDHEDPNSVDDLQQSRKYLFQSMRQDIQQENLNEKQTE